jgi:hypothetical protein
MAYTPHAPTLGRSDPSADAGHTHHPFTLKRICLGVLLLCIAAAALALPLVRDALNLIQSQAHWAPLEHWLAQAPMASWLMMFVWGTLTPVSLLVMLRYHRNVLGVLAAIGFALVAVVWYMHMPALAQCAALYNDSIWCAAISWGYSLSLGIANAVYLFALVMALLGGISVATTSGDDEEDEAAA